MTEDTVVCRLELHSNYDCTNSFDTLENSDYLRAVYAAVKTSVTRKAMMHEHVNGAYGGALFCFVFRTTADRLNELSGAIVEGQAVRVPKGTQFGFHSRFQGASSPFDETTRRGVVLAARYGPTEYDRIEIVDDGHEVGQYNYSIRSVYGDTGFIRPADVIVLLDTTTSQGGLKK